MLISRENGQAIFPPRPDVLTATHFSTLGALMALGSPYLLTDHIVGKGREQILITKSPWLTGYRLPTTVPLS